jgi:hypothetical protein
LIFPSQAAWSVYVQHSAALEEGSETIIKSARNKTHQTTNYFIWYNIFVKVAYKLFGVNETIMKQFETIIGNAGGL